MTRITNPQAELLLHRYATERVPILAWFMSADSSVKVRMIGFVSNATSRLDVLVTAEWPRPADVAMHSYINLRGGQGSWCEYSEEIEMPEDHKRGSGLILHMPNGDTLTIFEPRQLEEGASRTQ